jgi:hypothetical protein
LNLSAPLSACRWCCVVVIVVGSVDVLAVLNLCESRMWTLAELGDSGRGGALEDEAQDSVDHKRASLAPSNPRNDQ